MGFSYDKEEMNGADLKSENCPAWYCTPLIPALGMAQANGSLSKFQVGQVYRMRPALKTGVGMGWGGRSEDPVRF